MPKISNSIKSGDFGEFDTEVRDASGAVCALTESAAQVSNQLCFILLVILCSIHSHFYSLDCPRVLHCFHYHIINNYYLLEWR